MVCGFHLSYLNLNWILIVFTQSSAQPYIDLSQLDSSFLHIVVALLIESNI